MNLKKEWNKPFAYHNGKMITLKEYVILNLKNSVKEAAVKTATPKPQKGKATAQEPIHIVNSLNTGGGGGWGWFFDGGGDGGGNDKFWVTIEGYNENLNIEDPESNPVVQLAQQHGGVWKTTDEQKKSGLTFKHIGMVWFGTYARHTAMEFVAEAMQKFPNQYRYYYENEFSERPFEVFPFDQRQFDKLLKIAQKFRIYVEVINFLNKTPVFIVGVIGKGGNIANVEQAAGLVELYRKMYEVYQKAKAEGFYGSSVNWKEYEKDWKGIRSSLPKKAIQKHLTLRRIQRIAKKLNITVDVDGEVGFIDHDGNQENYGNDGDDVWSACNLINELYVRLQIKGFYDGKPLNPDVPEEAAQIKGIDWEKYGIDSESEDSLGDD